MKKKITKKTKAKASKRNFKVEFKVSETYMIDVKAVKVSVAVKKARKIFDLFSKKGGIHYWQVGDSDVYNSGIYDVTHSDDPFDPIN